MDRATTPIIEDDFEDKLFLLKQYYSEAGELIVQTDTASGNIVILPEEVLDIIKESARDGRIIYPWKYLYTCVIALVNQIIASFERSENDRIVTTENELIEDINFLLSTRFKLAPPFTVQRLCELLIDPRQYYNKKLNYLRAIDKVLTVISHAKVYYNYSETGVNRLNSLSPPQKKLKHDTNTNSTEIFDLLEPTTSLYYNANNDINTKSNSNSQKMDAIVKNNCLEEADSISECSVSEADSTTTTIGLRQPDELTHDSNCDIKEELTTFQECDNLKSMDQVQIPLSIAPTSENIDIGIMDENIDI